MSEYSKNKRIAINTISLYFRMLLIMVVTLYTSRVILDVLGVEDYGIYNVVGGIVVFLSFLNSALNTATQRYMNYEMGKKNIQGIQDVFSSSLILYGIISIVFIILAETVGLWFVNTILVIPESKIVAAHWVYQCSIISFVINLLSVPYNASIIAHEKMTIYAYISVFEVVLKLVLVCLLKYIDLDKLILYSILMSCVQVLVFFVYRFFCLRNFLYCRFVFVWNKTLMTRLFSFSGWMLSGTITNLLSTQGVNILINVFFGPVLNASRGIAMQVYGAVSSFVVNFMTAVRPQICKSYAEEDYCYMYKLVFSSSRLSFYLIFILSLPILLNTHYILSIWLTDVPEYTTLFTQLVLIDLLMTASYSAIAYVSQASGKIKYYQIVISISFLLIAGLTWAAYRYGFPVETTFVIAIIIDFIGLFARIIVLNKTVGFPIKEYLQKVYLPICIVIAAALFLAGLPQLVIDIKTIPLLLLNVIWIIAITGLFIWFFGLDKREKQLIINGIHRITRH